MGTSPGTGTLKVAGNQLTYAFVYQEGVVTLHEGGAANAPILRDGQRWSRERRASLLELTKRN